MFKSAILSAVTATLLAGSAFAGVSSGEAQLARQAQVEPGQYTTAEMLNIIDARRNNDKQALEFFLSTKNRAELSNDGPGAAQLAKIAGVAPGTYSVADLTNLIEAKRDNDTNRVKFILSGENHKEGDPASVVTPAEIQLAASVGVDAAQYTLAELVAMQPTSDD